MVECLLDMEIEATEEGECRGMAGWGCRWVVLEGARREVDGKRVDMHGLFELVSGFLGWGSGGAWVWCLLELYPWVLISCWLVHHGMGKMLYREPSRLSRRT